MLGRDNSYGAQDGLVTRGIYRWTRNPQNAMLVVVYGCLAIAADGGPTYVLCAAMMAVYILMVLRRSLGWRRPTASPYRRYCQRVPRFFNWRRAGLLVRAWARRPRRAWLWAMTGGWQASVVNARKLLAEAAASSLTRPVERSTGATYCA